MSNFKASYTPYAKQIIDLLDCRGGLKEVVVVKGAALGPTESFLPLTEGYIDITPPYCNKGCKWITAAGAELCVTCGEIEY